MQLLSMMSNDRQLLKLIIKTNVPAVALFPVGVYKLSFVRDDASGAQRLSSLMRSVFHYSLILLFLPILQRLMI